MSGQAVLAVAASVPWICNGRGRAITSVLVGVAAAAASWNLPWEMRLIDGFDAAALAYIVLFIRLMIAATPEQAADLSRRTEPSGRWILLATIALSAVSFGAIAAMLDNLNDSPRWLRIMHIAGSILALFLNSGLAHIIFGLEYMRMYYDEVHVIPGDAAATDLEFPTRPMPDFWDFMYYSFTIAMCYQTSDVTISAPDIRRLTLGHAIFSFLYFVLIISLVVNLLSNTL